MSKLLSIGTKMGLSGLALSFCLGGVAVMASSNPTVKADLEAVKSAITSKDLSKYKEAKNKLIDDNAKSKKEYVNATTQDQLNTKAEKVVKITALNEAIKNNDYNAYRTAQAAMKNRPAPTDAQIQTRFDKLVAAYKLDGSLPNTEFNPGFGGRGHGKRLN